MVIQENGHKFEWDDSAPVNIHTPVAVTGPQPGAEPRTISFGGLCNQSGGEVWRIFERHGYV